MNAARCIASQIPILILTLLILIITPVILLVIAFVENVIGYL